jgi:hypothetical protein
VLEVDHALVQAIGKADKKAVAGLLDANFTWTDTAGKTLTKAERVRIVAVRGCRQVLKRRKSVPTAYQTTIQAAAAKE